MSDPSGNPPPDQYGQPGQYSQYPASDSPQYGAPAQYGAPPPSYRGWAITSIVLGVIFFGLIGLILGIIATVQSGRVRSRWTSGDPEGAARASRITKTLCIVTTVLEVIGLLLIIVVIASHGSTSS
jgi:Interferon-induced transmembrane protein